MDSMSDASIFKHRNLPLLLLQAREAVLSRFRPLLKANGVSEQQWRIVRALIDSGPMEPRQIVQLCGISSPSLTGVLARMDELGWVRRERFDNDARRVMVTLTPKSRALVRRLAPDIEALYVEIEKLVGRELTQSLYQSLDALIARLGPGDDAISDE
jgi:homoprotocatechuate degradation regulator HpaR